MKNQDTLISEGEKLKKIRKELKLTQADFAEKIGSTQAAIAMVEKGQRAVSSSIKYQLLLKLGIDWDNDSSTAPDNKSNISKHSIGIPYYEAKVAAGGGVENINYPESKLLYFDKRWLENVLNVQPENLSIVQAEGDSMLPIIHNGDLLLVDNSKLNVVNNKVFVIRQDNFYRVKRLKKEIDGTLVILSDNHNYPPEITHQETTIIGQVIWNGSKENI